MSTTIQSLNSYVETPITPSQTQPQTNNVFNQIGNNTEMSLFVSSHNVEMLWNIIIQNAVFNSVASNNDTRSKLRQHYITHLKKYVENTIRSKIMYQLIDLNKNFIAEFIRGFKETSPQPPKLNISNTTPIENSGITIEEIKAERQSDFDNKYDKMKNDFEQYRITEVVSDTNFTDNAVVEPIKNQDMDDLLTRTIQNRTEQENTSVPRNVHETENARNWLNLNDTEKHINKVIQQHPEREKKSVSFLTDINVPQHDIPPTTPPPIIAPPTIAPPTIAPPATSEPNIPEQSPITALQTQVSEIETKIDNMYSMISRLTDLIEHKEDKVEENTFTNISSKDTNSIEVQTEKTTDE